MAVSQIMFNLRSINRSLKMKYQHLSVQNCKVFYREAGNPENPTILLLHGFPSASHMFRDLIPELADKYHLIAPDHFFDR